MLHDTGIFPSKGFIFDKILQFFHILASKIRLKMFKALPRLLKGGPILEVSLRNIQFGMHVEWKKNQKMGKNWEKNADPHIHRTETNIYFRLFYGQKKIITQTNFWLPQQTFCFFFAFINEPYFPCIIFHEIT